MKHIWDNLEILREKWTESLTLGMIAENFQARPLEYSAKEARKFMENRDWDVLGLTEGQENCLRIVAYVHREDLAGGVCGDYQREFGIDTLVSWYAPIRHCLPRLCQQEWLFVLGRDGVEGIVTLADLQKQPVRMMLFSIVSLLEMALLRLIRKRYPNEEWRDLLSEDRIEGVKRLFDQRKDKGQQIDLADCLQICDKSTILLRAEGLCGVWGFSSKRRANEFFDDLQTLRDNLAHSQDPTCGDDWQGVLSIVQEAEVILDKTADEVESGLSDDDSA